MKNLTCIVCPIGCSLSIEEGALAADGFPDLNVTGNRCPRGAVYAREEVRAPKRVVTATCGIKQALSAASGGIAPSLTAPQRLPVKTSAPCPKEKIPELLKDIYHTQVTLPVKIGEKIISGWKDSGIDVIAVRSMN
jgi:CxxC motif-containing protein